MDICHISHMTDIFAIDKTNKKFIAEASTLQANNAYKRAFYRVYNDSYDMGFNIISQKSDRVATFAVFEMEHDQEGDVLFWSLAPTRATLKKIPELKGWTAVVFND